MPRRAAPRWWSRTPPRAADAAAAPSTSARRAAIGLDHVVDRIRPPERVGQPDPGAHRRHRRARRAQHLDELRVGQAQPAGGAERHHQHVDPVAHAAPRRQRRAIGGDRLDPHRSQVKFAATVLARRGAQPRELGAVGAQPVDHRRERGRRSPGSTRTIPRPAAAMSSGPPSPRLPIAGSPAAIASTNATPNGSSTPGITNRSHAAARATASGLGELPEEPDAIGHAQLGRQPLEARPARAVADHQVLGPARRVDHRQRPQHDLVALAGDQMRHRHHPHRSVPRMRGGRRRGGRHPSTRPAPEGAGRRSPRSAAPPTCCSRAPDRPPPSPPRTPAAHRAVLRHVDHVRPVGRDDKRGALATAPAHPARGRVTRRRQAMSVQHVERPLGVQAVERPAQRRRHPVAPAAVRDRAWRRHERHGRHRQPIEGQRPQRCPGPLDPAAQLTDGGGNMKNRQRWDRTAQCENAHLGPGVARGHRLAVRPDAQHRIAARRVPLGYDRDAHREAIGRRRTAPRGRGASRPRTRPSCASARRPGAERSAP